MTQLDNISNGNSHKQDSFSDKLSREGSLLAGAPDTAWSGLKARAEDSWDHKLETGAEVVGSFALGTGLAMALRNPETAAVARFVPLAASALISTDLIKRLGGPMRETWNDPSSLARNKVRLGANIGAMAFDYTLMGTAGGLGAHFGPGLAGKALGLSTASEASGSAMSRVLNPLETKPSLAAAGPKIGDSPIPRAVWEGPGPKIGGSPIPRAAWEDLMKPTAFNPKISELGILTTTKTVGLPVGSDMGLAVASVADWTRPRHGTNLGALTEITPFRANFNEAFKGMQFQSGEMIRRLDADQATFQDNSKAWLKSLDKQLLKTPDKQ